MPSRYRADKHKAFPFGPAARQPLFMEVEHLEDVMRRMIRDYAEVRECHSLDALIERLVAVRDRLPDPAEAEVRMRGDDVFGRLLSISYRRPQTEEERACDARCVATLPGLATRSKG